ncbi:MAG: hypothetical protein IKB01_14490 [Lachnospiraceae bacterium]|nr:hypothetical protein [Lachnospiraceae bacterium]MBR4083895.1 hypothetical protein [Lachnospiraceae bacterium]
MEQTNRTILFEEINPGKENLLTYIHDSSKEGVTDETLQLIHNNLEVSSLEECIRKLQPEIYLALDGTNKKVICTTSREEITTIGQSGGYEVCSTKIHEDYPLLRYYTNMIKGETNCCLELEDNITQLLFPFPDEKEVYGEYSHILSLFRNRRKKEAEKAIKKFVEKYNNLVILVYLVVLFSSKELEALESEDDVLKIIVKDKENIQTSIEKVSNAFLYKHITIPEKSLDKYRKWIDEILEEEQNGEWFKTFFYIVMHGQKQDADTIREIYYQSLEFHINIVESYWNQLRPLLEKLLGIYTYFAQYTVDAEGMKPKLLISNITPRDLNDIKAREKLRLFLSSTNGKVFTEHIIWYGIIPHMEYKGIENSGGVRERFKGSNKLLLNDINSYEEVELLAKILTEYRIQIFFSPVSGEHSCAEWIAQNGIEEWIECQENIVQKEYAEYMYPCFPNFALSSNTYMEVDINIRESKAEDSLYRDTRKQLWLRNCTIEASYVAAGIYAAIQCPEFLEKHFPRRINKETPGVSFRIHENQSYVKLPCVLKTGMLGYTDELLSDIERKCCGIFFAPYNNRLLIIQDCAMSKMFGLRNSLSMIQTLTYIERKMRYETQDFKSTLIEQFFQKRPGSLIGKWEKSGEYYNSILKTGETIQYKLDKDNRECVFEVTFNDTTCQRTVFLN